MGKNIYKLVTLTVCAAMILAFAAGSFFFKTEAQEMNTEENITAVTPEYPEPTAEGQSAQQFIEGDEHFQWWNSQREYNAASSALQTGMRGYYTALMEKLLTGEEANTVCSPLNIYIAFAMLAEVSDGNTRQQILDMLGAEDIETLRENILILWHSNYADTPNLKSLLANSFWLNSTVDYNMDTLKLLAEKYYASSFSGIPGSQEMDKALQTWTDENTGSLLSEYVKDMTLDPETVLALVSTIYYKAAWTDDFNEQGTSPETFHGTRGDTTVDMMHRSAMMNIYVADTYNVVGLNLDDSGSMYFYLPDEGVDVDTLLADPDILKAMYYDMEDERWHFPIVNLSIPKFRVSGKTDLIETIKELGIIDALDAGTADFTPLTESFDGIYLSGAEHAAMVEIDEQGVTGAAYTELFNAGSAAMPDEEVDFVVDRPFMFVITGRDGSLLFAGIVRNID